MGKNLKDMTRQEQTAYFKSKDYCGEELKIVMDAISYGIGADYLQLFEDTTIPVEIMENMFTAMKSGIPLTELQQIYQDGMLPIELREKILPLMQGREAVPEKIGEKMEFITEAVRELKESFLMQNSFIEELRKTMEEKPDIFSVQEKGAEEDAGTADDPYYLELEEQFRQAREDPDMQRIHQRRASVLHRGICGLGAGANLPLRDHLYHSFNGRGLQRRTVPDQQGIGIVTKMRET